MINKLRIQPISLALLLGAMGSVTCQASSAPDSCPRDGVVLAMMRDVERDAEGVSYATFGALPDHVADFDRAAGVLTLLKQVWMSANESCPELPVDAVSAVNDAIAALDAALAEKNQRAAAYAANDIHLQMAPLFDYYNSDAPIEIVRMDATFLRIGLDGWFGDWQAFDTEVSSLTADWGVLKSVTMARVPMCHRVAGTQSVVGDIEDTLTNLRAAAQGKDVSKSQLESDAGLLEVDILELLFDCPPDGVKPTSGIGAACGGKSDCDPGQVCDLDNAGGRCAPDPATTNVGAPCTTTVDCGTYERDACNNEVGDGFPGGYCSMEPCDDVQVCSPGATCVAMPFETPACMKSCTQDSDCRTAEGYVCQLFPTAPPVGFGPSDHACAFACTNDDECTSPLTCDVASGRCIP